MTIELQVQLKKTLKDLKAARRDLQKQAKAWAKLADKENRTYSAGRASRKLDALDDLESLLHERDSALMLIEEATEALLKTLKADNAALKSFLKKNKALLKALAQATK